MLMPASTEFVTLCRAQVQLLIQGLGASMIAVYLTEEFSGGQQAELIPVVLYPEEAEPRLQALPMAVTPNEAPVVLVDAPSSVAVPQADLKTYPEDPQTQGGGSLDRVHPPVPVPQMVLPLMQGDGVLGLLVVAREQRQWSPIEEAQLQQVAETLAVACVMDQRSQWLARSRFQQRALQAEQHQTLANLLHQFRSPLTALRTLGKLLSKRFQGDANNHQLADSIVQQSDRLEELLQQFDGVIDLGEAALEPPSGSDFGGSTSAGDTSPKSLPPARSPLTPLAVANITLQPCWVEEILQPLLTAELGVIDEKRLQLSTEIPAELPPVKADAVALREVLSNVIDNACKYTPAGGEVRVRVNRSPGRPASQTISVSDSGPGIPEADLERVFERHYRGVQAQTDIPGTGLGLAIAHSLIEQMGGQIQVSSPATDRSVSQELLSVGPGCTFNIELPEC